MSDTPLVIRNDIHHCNPDGIVVVDTRGASSFQVTRSEGVDSRRSALSSRENVSTPSANQPHFVMLDGLGELPNFLDAQLLPPHLRGDVERDVYVLPG